MQYLKLTEYYQQLEKTSKRLEKTYIVSELLKSIKTLEEAEALIHLLRGSVFPSWDERKIGISEKLIIKSLAKSAGNTPEKVEKLWAKKGDLGEIAQELFKLVQGAYDQLTKPPVEDPQDADDALGAFVSKACADVQATFSSLQGKLQGLFQKTKNFAQNDQVQRLAFCFVAREFLRATGSVDADLSVVQEFLLQWKLLSSFDN